MQKCLTFQKYAIRKFSPGMDRLDGSGVQEYGIVYNEQSVELNVLPASNLQLLYNESDEMMAEKFSCKGGLVFGETRQFTTMEQVLPSNDNDKVKLTSLKTTELP